MDVQIACPCPPKANGEPRHESDTVTFRDKLGFNAVMAIRRQMYVLKAEDQEITHGEILAMMSVQYILLGAESWTLVDDKNKPVPMSRQAVREFMEFMDFDTGEAITDAVDGLYSSAVLDPLVARAEKSSPPTPTAGSIFQTRASGSPDQTAPNGSPTPKSPRPSKRSSTTTSRTVGTGTITQLPKSAVDSSPSIASAR